MNRDELIEQLLSEREGGFPHSRVSSLQDANRRPLAARPSDHALSRLQPAKHEGALYDRLTARAAETEAKIERRRAELAEEKLAVCTFTPAVHGSGTQQKQPQVHQRLYKDAIHRHSKRAMTAKNQAGEDVIVTEHRRSTAANDAHVPLHKRIGTIQKAQRDKQLQLRLKYAESNVQLPSRPPRKPRRAAQSSRRRDKAVRMQALRDSGMRECTFKPEVSAVSLQLVNASGSTFWQRNQPKSAEAAAPPPPPPPAECTFKPDIGNAEQILAVSRPQMLVEDQQSQAVRLSAQDAAAQEASRAAAAAAQRARFTFKPHIDAVSDSIAPPSNVDTLSAPKQPSKQQLAWAEEAAAREAAECPFAPQLGASTRRITSHSNGSWKQFSLNAADVHSLSQRITELRSKRDVAAKRAASRQAFQELKECTFAPRLTKPKRRTNKPVIVNGLGNHLKRHTRRAPAHTHDASPSARPSITQVQPFHFS